MPDLNQPATPKRSTPKKRETYETKTNLTLLALQKTFGDRPFTMPQLLENGVFPRRTMAMLTHTLVKTITEALEEEIGPQMLRMVIKALKTLRKRGLIEMGNQNTALDILEIQFTAAGYKRFQAIANMYPGHEDASESVPLIKAMIGSPEKQSKKRLREANEVLADKVQEQGDEITKMKRRAEKERILQDFNASPIRTPAATTPLRKTMSMPAYPSPQTMFMPAYPSPQSFLRSSIRPLQGISESPSPPSSPIPNHATLPDIDDRMDIDGRDDVLMVGSSDTMDDVPAVDEDEQNDRFQAQYYETERKLTDYAVALQEATEELAGYKEKLLRRDADLATRDADLLVSDQKIAQRDATIVRREINLRVTNQTLARREDDVRFLVFLSCLLNHIHFQVKHLNEANEQLRQELQDERECTQMLFELMDEGSEQLTGPWAKVAELEAKVAELEDAASKAKEKQHATIQSVMRQLVALD
ncbi:hypothetical protein C8F01DRAFT_1105359 [Mycena amicta]|nr:hypothetical protein C8F01DRAFT_1105359 [Mycena amicta]